MEAGRSGGGGTQPAGHLPWPNPPWHDGYFRYGPARVEVKQGQVVALWGSRLTTPAGKELRLGQTGESVLKLLGKPADTLYGCGRTSQQVHFYTDLQLDVTVTDNKITRLRLYQK